MTQSHSHSFTHGPETYKVESAADLKDMPTSTLLAFYRKLTGKDTTRFASRDKGEAAVMRALDALAKETAKKDPRPTAGATKPARERKATGERKARNRRFVFKKDSTLKPPREGTKRHDLLQLLRQESGATEVEIQQTIGWTDKQAYEGIRLMHFAHGYGLAQTDDGRIKVVE